VVDVTSGRRFARRADEPFPTASAIKIGILYELFAQADAGRQRLDEPRPLPEASRAGGSGILQRLTSPVLSLRDHALLMILLSDNTATNVLIDTLGLDAITARMRELGASGYALRRRMMDTAAAARGDENVASPADLVTVMDALRTGRGLQPASRDAAHAILREYGPTSIRAGVPAGVPVATKPGGLDGVRTEVAWVDLKGRPYLMCVMTTFLADEQAGEAAITAMSRASHLYFSRLARAGVEGRLLPP
jgi:beta-lactamase class A